MQFQSPPTQIAQTSRVTHISFYILKFVQNQRPNRIQQKILHVLVINASDTEISSTGIREKRQDGQGQGQGRSLVRKQIHKKE